MYSMLDGDALTAVEHLEFPEIAIEGGEDCDFHYPGSPISGQRPD